MEGNDFSAAEFLGANGQERARRCREFAAEADGLAATAINSEVREAYLDLKRKWNELADEIVRFANGNSGET